MTKISTLFRTYRKSNRLSQAKLAKKLGYTSPQFISNIERGNVQISPRLSKRIAKILSIPEELVVNAMMRDLENYHIKKMAEVYPKGKL